MASKIVTIHALPPSRVSVHRFDLQTKADSDDCGSRPILRMFLGWRLGCSNFSLSQFKKNDASIGGNVKRQTLLNDSESIDTIDYFLTKHPEVALEDVTGQPINQIIDPDLRRAYLVKWGPRSFIGYTWDNDYIYFREEHEMDFPWATPQQLNYSFAPGYWFKRTMRVGDSIDGTVTGNVPTVISYYDTPHTCGPGYSGRYFMKTVLESHQPEVNLGGDIGVQDVVVLRIEQGSFSEKEWYSRKYGLVRWQYCDFTGVVCSENVTWNLISKDPPRQIDRSAACLPELRDSTPNTPDPNVENYIRIEYTSIYHVSPATSTLTFLSGVYQSGAIGCVGLVRDLLKTDPLRPAPSDFSPTANAKYIEHLYHVAFRRTPIVVSDGTGDSPLAIRNLRQNGASLEDIEAIFLSHPEFNAICTASGLRMFPAK